METKQHWSVHVAPVHGALEEAEAVAGFIRHLHELK